MRVLALLLKDGAASRNILWGARDHEKLGDGYGAEREIAPSLLVIDGQDVIRPRTAKSRREQSGRTRERAENKIGGSLENLF